MEADCTLEIVVPAKQMLFQRPGQAMLADTNQSGQEIMEMLR
jgi:hypothetical protein